jgi:hypothetical protein
MIAEMRLDERRLVVRRTRVITERNEELEQVEAEHRQHSVVELAIRDHENGPLRHASSGHYTANAAWCRQGSGHS